MMPIIKHLQKFKQAGASEIKTTIYTSLTKICIYSSDIIQRCIIVLSIMITEYNLIIMPTNDRKNTVGLILSG